MKTVKSQLLTHFFESALAYMAVIYPRFGLEWSANDPLCVPRHVVDINLSVQIPGIR